MLIRIEDLLQNTTVRVLATGWLFVFAALSLAAGVWSAAILAAGLVALGVAMWLAIELCDRIANWARDTRVD